MICAVGAPTRWLGGDTRGGDTHVQVLKKSESKASLPWRHYRGVEVRQLASVSKMAFMEHVASQVRGHL